MTQNHPFAREEIFPSWFANRVQDYIQAAQLSLPLSLKNATTIQVVPASPPGLAAVNIAGRWRFITAPVERAHPGGAKGTTWTVWAVAEDNVVDNTPDPFTDHTNYAFDLRITNGTPPTGAGTAVVTKIGEVDWSGTAITALRQTQGQISGAQIADGALSSAGGEFEWIREPGGALVPVLKKASIQDAKLEKPALVGAVTIDGKVQLGSFFTVQNTAQGKYEITLKEELPSIGVMLMQFTNVSGTAYTAVPPSRKLFECRTYSSTAQLANNAFSFTIKAG